MLLSFHLINGLALGVEFIPASAEADVEFPCLVIDLLLARIIIEFTGQ